MSTKYLILKSSLILSLSYFSSLVKLDFNISFDSLNILTMIFVIMIIMYSIPLIWYSYTLIYASKDNLDVSKLYLITAKPKDIKAIKYKIHPIDPMVQFASNRFGKQ